MSDQPMSSETSIVPLPEEDRTWELAEIMPAAIAPMPEAFVSVAAAIEALSGTPVAQLLYQLPMQGKPIGLTVWCVKSLAIARGNLEVTIPRHPTRGPWADIQISEDGQGTAYVEVPAVVASARVRDTLNNVSFEAEAVEEMIRRNKETGKLTKLEQAERSAQSKAIRDALRMHMATIEPQLKLHLYAEVRAGHEYVTGEVDPKWLQAESHREVVLEQRKHRGEQPLGRIQAALVARAVGAVEKAAGEVHGLKAGALMTEYQAFVASTWPSVRKPEELPESASAALWAWLRNRCSILNVPFPEDLARPPEPEPEPEPPTPEPGGAPEPPAAEPEEAPTPVPDSEPEPQPTSSGPTPAQAILIAVDELCASKDWPKAKVTALYRTAGVDLKRRGVFTEEEATRLLDVARKVATAGNGNGAGAEPGTLPIG